MSEQCHKCGREKTGQGHAVPDEDGQVHLYQPTFSADDMTKPEMPQQSRATTIPFVQFQVVNFNEWQYLYGLDDQGQLWISTLHSLAEDEEYWREDADWKPIVGPLREK